MGWQEVGGGTYVSWQDKKPGDIGVEGWFLEPVKSVNYEHNNYVFLTREGSKLIVNGCGYIHKAMENIRPGDYCQMSYMGLGTPSEKSKFKKNLPHMVKVLVDPEQRAIVNNGLFIMMAPKTADAAGPVGSPLPPAKSTKVPEPTPEPDESEDLDW
jgi:hypothetical protein